MKLLDFNDHSGLNDLREKMGADFIHDDFDPEWARIEVQLEESGIDVDISEIYTAEDSTFEYKGRKVLVYIRDQHKHVVDDGGGYKFHISHCSTYESMIKRNKQKRYVVTNRKDGLFLVNILENNAILEKETTLELHVCKNCLSNLKLPKDRNAFNILEFFKKHSNTIKALPSHTEITAPINAIYPSNWMEIATNVKDLKKWKCEAPECTSKHLFFKSDDLHKFLHLHHIDTDRTNNSIKNLMALCIQCHANQPGHQHMKALPNFKAFLRLKRLGVI